MAKIAFQGFEGDWFQGFWGSGSRLPELVPEFLADHQLMTLLPRVWGFWFPGYGVSGSGGWELVPENLANHHLMTLVPGVGNCPK